MFELVYIAACLNHAALPVEKSDDGIVQTMHPSETNENASAASEKQLQATMPARRFRHALSIDASTVQLRSYFRQSPSYPSIGLRYAYAFFEHSGAALWGQTSVRWATVPAEVRSDVDTRKLLWEWDIGAMLEWSGRYWRPSFAADFVVGNLNQLVLPPGYPTSDFYEGERDELGYLSYLITVSPVRFVFAKRWGLAVFPLSLGSQLRVPQSSLRFRLTWIQLSARF